MTNAPATTTEEALPIPIREPVLGGNWQNWSGGQGFERSSMAMGRRLFAKNNVNKGVCLGGCMDGEGLSYSVVLSKFPASPSVRLAKHSGQSPSWRET